MQGFFSFFAVNNKQIPIANHHFNPGFFHREFPNNNVNSYYKFP